MGFFNLAKMTFKGAFGKPETVKYPFEKTQSYERTRGHITVSIEDCIFCGSCQRSCPTSAIKVSKADRTWAINPYDCIQCGYCASNCPPNCLTMNPALPKAATVKQAYLYHQHPYSKEELAEIARKEAEKKAKAEARKKAAAEKKAAEKKAKAKLADKDGSAAPEGA